MTIVGERKKEREREGEKMRDYNAKCDEALGL